VARDDANPAMPAQSSWFARVGLPLLLVLAIGAGLLVGSVLTYRSNRAGALRLAERYITAIDDIVAREIRDYLAPAETAVALLSVSVGDNDITSRRSSAAQRLAVEMMRANRQFASLYLADSDGRFVMTRRKEDGTLERKIIAEDPEGRRVTLESLDDNGSTIRTTEISDDPYDPRTRSWFKDATATEALIWTDVYSFFTGGVPGVTAAVSRARQSAPDVVAGVDIALADLSRFLGELSLGETGRALIVDGTGKVLVAPPTLTPTRNSPSQRIEIANLGDPVLRELGDRFRVEREFSGIVEIGGSWYVALFSPIAAGGATDWWLIVEIPEDEFIAFVEQSSSESLLITAVVTAFALLLALLLAQRMLVADRQSRRIAASARLLDDQAASVGALAEVVEAAAGTEETRMIATARRLADASGARRVGLWRFEEAGARLSRIGCYDAELRQPADPVSLRRAAHSGLFETLARGEAIAADRASENPDLARALEACSDRGETRGFLSTPIVRGGQVLGAIWLEDVGALATPAGDPGATARAAAAMACAWMGAHGETGQSTADAPGATPPFGSARRTLTPATTGTASLLAARDRQLLAEATRRGLPHEDLREALFPNVAVLTVILRDPMALAEGARKEPLIAALARFCRTRAREHDAPFLKLLGNRALAATGFDADNPVEPAERLAMMALELQEDFAHASHLRAGRGVAAMGLEVGGVMGAALDGDSDASFTIWGDVVRLSGILAETAADGAVQVGDVAHAALRERCAFQPRGAFYVAGFGQTVAHYLRGRR